MTNIPLPMTRLRRLRQTSAIRRLVQETVLNTSDFIYPLFIKEGLSGCEAIAALPGQNQLGLDALAEEILEIQALGIPAVLLFGIPEQKDDCGVSSIDDNGIIQKAIREIKRTAPDLCVIADSCFCEYTTHGHCGVIENNTVGNDKTLMNLSEQALSFAKAGADIIAPSGMMDGTIAALRHTLDENQFSHIALLGYSAKYSSSFYGPFREAAGYELQFGDRKEYQMDPANGQEAIREVSLDVAEGVDMLMVKPAGSYLDVIYNVKQSFPDVPLSAYQVSGEYALIKHGASQGIIDGTQGMIESLIAIKRAGADSIITYFAKDMCRLLQK